MFGGFSSERIATKIAIKGKVFYLEPPENVSSSNPTSSSPAHGLNPMR